MEIPKSHPRSRSLKERNMLVEAMKQGYLADAGLIAHGRGEAFDYLLGEKTAPEAELAEGVGVAMLLLAEKPVISVNGNTVALVAKETVELARILNARIEINLFYRTVERERIIEGILADAGAEGVLGVGDSTSEHIPGLDSERGRVSKEGIFAADVVLVPLEDGDRAEALVAMGKKVIAIDLNPLSRTSQKATISIVDNVTRAIPRMIELAEELKDCDNSKLINNFDNKQNLTDIIKRIRKGV